MADTKSTQCRRSKARATHVARIKTATRRNIRAWYVSAVSPELRLHKRGKATLTEIGDMLIKACALFPDAQVLWYRNHRFYTDAVAQAFVRSKATFYASGLSSDKRSVGTYDRILVGIIKNAEQLSTLLKVLPNKKELRNGGLVVCFVKDTDKAMFGLDSTFKAKITPVLGWKLSLVVVQK